MDKAQVIASLAGDLKATEQSVDEAITRATTLVQSMIGGRAAMNVSPVVGAEAQTKAMEAIAALAAARQAEDKPDTSRPPTTGEHRLRAV